MTSKEEQGPSTALDKLKPPTDEYYSENCLELVFLMSRFREYLEVPAFTHIELEEELLKENNNYEAVTRHYSEVYRSLLLTQILEPLLNNFQKNSNSRVMDTDIIITVFAQRHFKNNPFGELISIDFHTLPTEIKVHTLLEMAQYYCEMEEAQKVDNFRKASELRVVNFGFCSEKYEVFYFQDFRLFRKHPASEFVNRPLPIDEKKMGKAPWKEVYNNIVRGDHYECIAWNNTSWLEVITKFEKGKAVDKKIAIKLKDLLKTISDEFDQLLSNYTTQRNTRMKLSQKMELELRRSMGLFRASARLQEKNKSANGDSVEQSSADESVHHNLPRDPKAEQAKSREERLNRRKVHKNGEIEDIAVGELSLDVEEVSANGKEKKDFESPCSTPNSLKEMQVSNFRIDKPPISPDHDLDSVKSFGEKVDTSDDVETPVEEPQPVIEKRKRGRIPGKKGKAPKRGRKVVDDSIPAPQTTNTFPRLNFKLMKGIRSSESGDSSSSGSLQPKEHVPEEPPAKQPRIENHEDQPEYDTIFEENAEIVDEVIVDEQEIEQIVVENQAVEEVEAIESTPNGQVEHVDEILDVAEPPETFFSSITPTKTSMLRAIRLIKWRYNYVYDDWKSFYGNRVPNLDDIEIFNSNFPENCVDDFKEASTKWTRLKMIIFRMPLRLGGVDGVRPRPVIFPIRQLALNYMKFLMSAWGLLFHEIGDIDKVLLSQTTDNIEIIEKLLVEDFKVYTKQQQQLQYA